MFRAEIKKDGILKHAAEFKTVPECTDWIAENAEYFPEGYIADIIDLTAIIRKQNRISNAKSRIDFGSELMAEIVAINEERFELGVLTPATFQAMLNDPILFKIERLLWNGSIVSAKTLIQNIDETYFNSTHKEYLIDRMDAFLLSIGESI
jgi:hypothetical protein